MTDEWMDLTEYDPFWAYGASTPLGTMPKKYLWNKKVVFKKLKSFVIFNCLERCR